MMDEEKWLEGDLRNVPDNSDEPFDVNLFLSTDRKMTVSVKSSTKAGRKAALEYAQNVYEVLLQKYGGKQEAAVKAYSKPAAAHENPAGWCDLHSIAMRRFEKEGRSWYSHKDGESWCKGK